MNKNFFYVLHDGKAGLYYKYTEQERLYNAQTGMGYYKATVYFTDDPAEAQRFEMATEALRVGAVLDDMKEEQLLNYKEATKHIKRLRIRTVEIKYELQP